MDVSTLVLVSVLGSTDLLYLYRAQDWQPSPKLFCLGNFLLVLVNAIPLFIWTNQEQAILGRWGWSLLVLLLLLLLGFIVEMYHYQQPGRAVAASGIAGIWLAVYWYVTDDAVTVAYPDARGTRYPGHRVDDLVCEAR